MSQVFITGGTGYIGQRLIPALIARGHGVRALVRRGSEGKLKGGAAAVAGNPLEGSTFGGSVAPSDTFIQLVGVPHPSPAKAEQFRTVDLVSIRASVPVAKAAGVKHFIYVSVAHPAPMMKAYIAVRSEGESLIRASGMNATILRPWYVVGPGHRWPMVLAPVYWILERMSSTRESARRLGLVRLEEIVRTLVDAVEHPAAGIRVIEVPEIRGS